MWKLTIIDRDNSPKALKFFYDNAGLEIERIGGSIEYSGEQKAVFIRVNEKFLAYCKAIIKQILAEAIIEKYKPVFFEKELKLSEKYDLNGIALLKTICVLDKAEDISEVKRSLVVSDGEFHLDSFWLFHLDELKLRWKEISNIMSINMEDIVTTDAFLDIVKYLLKLVDKHFSTIKVVETSKEILFCNENLEKVTPEAIPLKDKKKDEKVINKLIELSPTFLEWEGEHSPRLRDLALSIFN